MKVLFALLLTLCLAVTNAIAAVNVNTATQAELETLNGIGPTKAKAIIDYRTKNGPFKTIEELDKVPGIGEGTLKRIQKDVTLTGATTVKPDNKGAAKAANADKASRSSGETKTEKKAAADKKEEPKQATKKADDKTATAKESAGSTQKDATKGAATNEKKSGSFK